MYRTKSVVLDNIKPYFVARVLHPKKAKKKKIVKFSISFRSVAISCFPIGQDFNVLFHNIYRVFSEGWSVNVSCFPTDLIRLKTVEII